MLTQVDIINPVGSILKLPLEDVSAGVIVKEIDGLSPVKAAMASTVFANIDGEHYQSSRRGVRNITMKLGLEPFYGGGSAQDIRSRLYEFLSPKMPVKIIFRTDAPKDFVIDGIVEAFESPLFAREPEADISILCYNPDFVDPEENLAFGYGQTNYGYDYPGAIVNYAGSTPTGGRLEVFATAGFPNSFSEFSFYHLSPNGTETVMSFAMNQPVNYGDKVVINTVPGEKSAVAVLNGVETSILAAMNPESVWTTLTPGLNKFLLIDNMGTGSARWNFYYQNKYGGL